MIENIAEQINIVDGDSGIHIIKGFDSNQLHMPLSDIRTPADVNRWREHNQHVAGYFADYIRTVLFEPGSPVWEDYLHNRQHIPHDIQTVINTGKSESFYPNRKTDIIIDSTADLGGHHYEDDGIVFLDETNPRLMQLKALTTDQEIHTDIIHYLGDMLGVPMVNVFTAGLADGTGGHAMALIRTPYLNHGKWFYDVMDPLTLEPKVGIPLNAVNRDAAFVALAIESVRANTIGVHYLENRVGYNLLGKIGDDNTAQLFETIRHAGVGRLQKGEYINCQFMSLLIQAYLWKFYGSVNASQDAGGLRNISLGNIISEQFQKVFNASLKSSFDILGTVPLTSVPDGFKISAN